MALEEPDTYAPESNLNTILTWFIECFSQNGAQILI